MAKVLVVANQKGGAGKTVVSQAIARTLALRGRSVVLADADAQGTASHYGKSEYSVPVVSVAAEGRRLQTVLRKLGQTAEFLVVDCPPSIENPLTEFALLSAHLCLVPVPPAPEDLWATIGMQRLIEGARNVNVGLQARLVATRVSHSKLSRSVLDTLRTLSIPMLATRLSTRVAHNEAALYGVPVQRLGAGAKQAAAEVDALTDEVLKLLGENPHEEA